MKKKLFFSVCLSLPLALFPLSAPAEEGSPLLSVDDLIALEDSYEAFLNELGDLAVQRGLLSEEDRAAWHDAQLGDYFQNGGYGSILISYMPGALGYTREEGRAAGNLCHCRRDGGERWRNDRLERPDARRRRQRSGAHPADFARGRPDGAYGSETAAVRRRRGV